MRYKLGRGGAGSQFIALFPPLNLHSVTRDRHIKVTLQNLVLYSKLFHKLIFNTKGLGITGTSKTVIDGKRKQFSMVSM